MDVILVADRFNIIVIVTKELDHTLAEENKRMEVCWFGVEERNAVDWKGKKRKMEEGWRI